MALAAHCWRHPILLKNKGTGKPLLVLEAGKLADLVILDKNPLDRNVPDEDLSEITVVATLIGGKVIYGSLNPEQ